MEKYDIYNWKLTERLQEYIKRYGLKYTVEYSLEKLFSPFLHIYYNKMKEHEKFIFKGGELYYFYHKYRSTWANERIVEIPIFKNLIDKFTSNQILEVGNVLSHYYKTDYDILDKYERMENIIQKDILSYLPEKKYKLIISISTFEHIGWDENPRNPEKVKEVIEHIKKLLDKDGELVFSVPINYNPELDKMIFSGEIKLNSKIYLIRTDRQNHWVEAQEKDILLSKYGYPYFCANGLLIGSIRN
ncbi:MAG: hypothetical protein AB7T10_01805 [bacterium]